MQVFCPSQVGSWSVNFCGGRKTGKPGEKPSKHDENQQQTQSTYGTGIEPGPYISMRVLSPLQSSFFPKTSKAEKVIHTSKAARNIEQCMKGLGNFEVFCGVIFEKQGLIIFSHLQGVSLPLRLGKPI